MIFGMRNLSDSNKLSVRSIHEVFIMLHDMDGFVLHDQTLTYCNDGTPTPATRAAIVTALLLRIGKWEPEKQKQFLREGLKELDEILMGGKDSGDVRETLSMPNIDQPSEPKFSDTSARKPKSQPKRRTNGENSR